MNSLRARRDPLIPLIRELARTYQAFERYDQAGLRRLGLTTCQADVLFTLGNTEGMSMKELGERTLITKGTLTGVVDRMEKRGWVERRAAPRDRRSTLVVLTADGDAEFQHAFPAHIVHLKKRFDRLTTRDRESILGGLRLLRSTLAREGAPAASERARTRHRNPETERRSR